MQIVRNLMFVLIVSVAIGCAQLGKEKTSNICISQFGSANSMEIVSENEKEYSCKSSYYDDKLRGIYANNARIILASPNASSAEKKKLRNQINNEVNNYLTSNKCILGW